MGMVNLVGAGLWYPNLPEGFISDNIGTASGNALMDADEEEYQCIGQVQIAGGGSKTFGTSGSKIDWLAGATTFQSSATLRVGVKKAASIDTANGPPARATIGAAAFDVYKALIGGTDAITAAWRSDAMASGTPFTVVNGDLIAVCWHLDIVSAAQSVRVQNMNSTSLTMHRAVHTLVTTGPTYTAQNLIPSFLLTFDDGTLGWISGTQPFSVAPTNTAAIGNTNIIGNIFRVPFACQIDAIAASISLSANTSNCKFELYSTPLGTPGLMASVTIDAHTVNATGANKLLMTELATPQTIAANTDYCVGINQVANDITSSQVDVSNAAHFKPYGMGAECYAANSTAGATFSAQNSGKRRYSIWARISALDNGSGGSPFRGLMG